MVKRNARNKVLDLASHVSHIVFTESGSFVVARIRAESVTGKKNSVRYQRKNLPEFGPDSTLLSRNLPKDPEIDKIDSNMAIAQALALFLGRC